MDSTTKKMAASVNNFAAKTVSESEARSMNDFGAKAYSRASGGTRCSDIQDMTI